MDEKMIRKLIVLIKKHNARTRRSTVSIYDNGRILLAVRGPAARHMSNALYHLMRALGRRQVRRWVCGSDWCVAFS
jgi:hypothetical protein